MMGVMSFRQTPLMMGVMSSQRTPFMKGVMSCAFPSAPPSALPPSAPRPLPFPVCPFRSAVHREPPLLLLLPSPMRPALCLICLVARLPSFVASAKPVSESLGCSTRTTRKSCWRPCSSCVGSALRGRTTVLPWSLPAATAPCACQTGRSTWATPVQPRASSPPYARSFGAPATTMASSSPAASACKSARSGRSWTRSCSTVTQSPTPPSHPSVLAALTWPGVVMCRLRNCVPRPQRLPAGPDPTDRLAGWRDPAIRGPQLAVRLVRPACGTAGQRTRRSRAGRAVRGLGAVHRDDRPHDASVRGHHPPRARLGRLQC